MRMKLLLIAAAMVPFLAAPAQESSAQPAPAKPDRVTEITADKEARFDSEARVAVFTGNVEVKDPQFRLKTDKLTVYLDKQKGGLQRAEAEGNVQIVNENADKGSDGKPVSSRGKSERATYEPASGEVVLIGWPQIQQGINLHMAADPSTRMILNNNGQMRTLGRSKTIIKDTDKE